MTTELSVDNQIKLNKKLVRAKQKSQGIPCPQCGEKKTTRLTTRPHKGEPAVYRLRLCSVCSYQFKTMERIVALSEIIVLKRDGKRQPFDIEKLKRSMTSAIRYTAITQERVSRICQHILSTIDQYNTVQTVVTSAQIGQMVLVSLKALDPVAYLRYLSIHKHFKSKEDYIDAINQLV